MRVFTRRVHVEAPPPLTPPHKGEGDMQPLQNPSPLWGGAGVGAPRSELSGERAGTELWLLKNSFVQFQHLITIPKINSTISIPLHPSSFILHLLLSWDRMITGIRESGRPMAALDRGVRGGRSPSTMSLLAFAPFARRAPCASPGKKPRQGVWRAHTQHRLVPFGRTARPGLPFNGRMRKAGAVMRKAGLPPVRVNPLLNRRN